MKSQTRLPRRMFLIATLVALAMELISACNQSTEETIAALGTSTIPLIPSSTNTATPQPSLTSTPTQPPTASVTQIDLPTSTNTPTPTCLHILNPQDGAQFPELGQVRFEWESSSVAIKYRLEIQSPDGTTESFETFLTSVERYLFMYPSGGTYNWQVIALGHFGETLCAAGPFGFNKTAYLITTTPKKRNKEDIPLPGEGG